MTGHNSVAQVLREHVFRSYESLEGVSDWRKLPEIPSYDEVMGIYSTSHEEDDSDKGSDSASETNEMPALPFNLVDRPWNSKEDYIRTHYELLREDGVAPLRDAVKIFKSQPTMGDDENVAIYTHVSVLF
jgi:helicase required for RNAi-mediated heterochromatin assembly 1